MCDYSKIMQARDFCARRAKVGDELELIHIRGHGAHVRGFALWRGSKSAIGGEWVVTCLRPGTEIAFERRPVLGQSRVWAETDDGSLRIMASDIGDHVARTARLPGGSGYQRGVDGVEFADGRGIGLSCLDVGTRIKVLQLPVTKRRKPAKVVAKQTKARRRQAEPVR